MNKDIKTSFITGGLIQLDLVTGENQLKFKNLLNPEKDVYIDTSDGTNNLVSNISGQTVDTLTVNTLYNTNIISTGVISCDNVITTDYDMNSQISNLTLDLLVDKTNIATNSTNIIGVQASSTKNQTDIAINLASSTKNQTDIINLASDIAASSTKNQTDIANIVVDQTNLASDIATNLTSIHTLQYDLILNNNNTQLIGQYQAIIANDLNIAEKDIITNSSTLNTQGSDIAINSLNIAALISQQIINTEASQHRYMIGQIVYMMNTASSISDGTAVLLLCNGQSFDSSTYSSFYSMNGSSNIVPNIMGGAVIRGGYDQQISGSNDITLVTRQLPPHNHGLGIYPTAESSGVFGIFPQQMDRSRLTYTSYTMDSGMGDSIDVRSSNYTCGVYVCIL